MYTINNKNYQTLIEIMHVILTKQTKTTPTNWLNTTKLWGRSRAPRIITITNCITNERNKKISKMISIIDHENQHASYIHVYM